MKNRNWVKRAAPYIAIATLSLLVVSTLIGWFTYKEVADKFPELKYDIRVSSGELDRREWTLTEKVMYQENGKPYSREELTITVWNSGNAPAQGVFVRVVPWFFDWGQFDLRIRHAGETKTIGKRLAHEWGPLAPSDAFDFELEFIIELSSVKTAIEEGDEPKFQVSVHSTEEEFEKFIKLQVKTFDNKIVP